MAIFKWDYTYFMTAEDVKKMKDKPEPLKPIKALDLQKAERIFITKEEIKMRELQEQEKLKQI